MKYFIVYVMIFLVCANGFAQFIPLRKNDRIGWSSDGNQHDSDDWGATAIALAMFARAGVQDRFVHFDYGSWLPDNAAYKYAENIKSTFGGGNSHNWEDVEWLKELPNEDYRWVWQRIWAGGQGKPKAKRGALDVSDGTMAYWLLTGDEGGDFLKLKKMLDPG
jgi:hypothetical protein